MRFEIDKHSEIFMKRWGKFLLLFLFGCFILLACKKEDGNGGEIVDNREAMTLVDEPTGETYYEGGVPEYTKTVIFSKDMLYSGFYYFRSPVMVTTNAGTILVCVQMRTSTDDDDPKTLVCRRSTDNGATWEDLSLIEELTKTNVYGNQNFVLDKTTGTIHLLYLQVFPSSSGNNCTMYQRTSTDDGVSWSERVEVPNVISARWRPLGPTTGIQLTNGKHKGRLFFTGRYITSSNAKGNYGIYSDDSGVTWLRGYVSSASNTDGVENETTCVELAETNANDEATIYINSRNETSASTNVYRRLDAYSEESGESLTGYFSRNSFIKTDMCQGCLFRWSSLTQGDESNRILFSGLTWAPEDATVSSEKRRRHIGIWSTFDETKTWNLHPKRLNDLKAGYSGMAKTNDGYLGIVFEEGEDSYYSQISFVKTNTAFLDVPLISAKWDFESLTSGTKITEGNQFTDTYSGGTSRDITSYGTLKATIGSTVFGQETALKFDGSSYLKMDDLDTWTQFDFDEDASFTIEMILKTNMSEKTSFLIGRPHTSTWPQWFIQLESDGKVGFRIDDDESYAFVKSSDYVNDNIWHHIAVVRDRNLKKIRIYIDGVLSNSVVDNVQGSLANRRPLYVAGQPDMDNKFIGEIDYMRISSFAISDFFE